MNFITLRLNVMISSKLTLNRSFYQCQADTFHLYPGNRQRSLCSMVNVEIEYAHR